jgi:hypothetical protein
VTTLAAPTLTRITASSSCVSIGSGLQNCPVSSSAANGNGVTLTLTGADFGTSGASVSGVCADTPVHTLNTENTQLTCTLAAGSLNAAFVVRVTTAAGVASNG